MKVIHFLSCYLLFGAVAATRIEELASKLGITGALKSENELKSNHNELSHQVGGVVRQMKHTGHIILKV